MVVAAILLLVNPQVGIPLVPSVEPVSADQISPGARRIALGDPPITRLGAITQRCSDCHVLFETEREPGRDLVQHTEIQLRHGSNDTCLNCHDRGDRERLAIRNAEPVGFADVAQLCSQCHGPVYRDWAKGAHGKTIGAWDLTSSDAVRLSCTQCHDPHSPAYEAMAPLPGPNTLRMGDPHANHNAAHPDQRNPLRRWRTSEGADEHGKDPG